MLAGEDLALYELMSRWPTGLLNFTYRHTGNREVPLDIAQETFVRSTASLESRLVDERLEFQRTLVL